MDKPTTPEEMSHVALVAILMQHGGALTLPPDALDPEAVGGPRGWHAVSIERQQDGTLRVAVQARPDAPHAGMKTKEKANDHLFHLDTETGAGFDAPTPQEAYANAPDLTSEALELIAETYRLSIGHKLENEEAERGYLLRRAAYADRCAIAEPQNVKNLNEAVRLSQELIKWDRQHPHHVRGAIGPNAIEWDPSARPYVRQEWAAAH
ncbi:hypothetical protein ACFUCH_35475 [Streptomyces olivaceus]|uniref:hypothetical protein n=1 Tax=Streptomyces olivaceus TaxID=47716 RepID=UPI00363D6ED0